MLASLVAAQTALTLSLRHQRTLQITPKERTRYLVKSLNLALCYRGFVCGGNLRHAFNAGRAAFCCCAYDVVTDWRHFDGAAFTRFKKILDQEVTIELARIAQKLYRQERDGILLLDGLSRGIDALTFVTKLIGSEDYIRQRLNFDQLGIVMQIIDDVIDLEEDLHNGETNCLLASVSRRTKYLHVLTAFDLNAFRRLFPHAVVLRRVTRLAMRKAERLLLAQAAMPEKATSINGSPDQNINHEEKSEVSSCVGD